MWDLNSQPQDQQSHALLTKPARQTPNFSDFWSHAAYLASVPPLSPLRAIKRWYLYVTVVSFGDERDLNREEIIGLPSNAEFEAATLIFGINHWQAPLQGISSTVMSILAINLANHRCADTGSVMRNTCVTLAVQSWKNSAKENQPRIWLCSSNSAHFIWSLKKKTRFPNNRKDQTVLAPWPKGPTHCLL